MIMQVEVVVVVVVVEVEVAQGLIMTSVSPRDALPVQSRPTDNALAGLLYDPEEPSGPCL